MERIPPPSVSSSSPLKIYLLPFFAQGHQIPLVHLAHLLSSRAHHVTILTTPSNAQLFHHHTASASALGHHIYLHIINFPTKQLALPDGVENLFFASNNNTANKIHMAAHLLQPEIEAFLSQSPPHAFIPDIMFTWTEATAKRLGIPRFVFNPISIFDVCIMEAIQSHPKAFDESSGPYRIPGLPHPLTLPIKPSPGFVGLTESLMKGEEGSHGVIVNSFAELDVEYTQHYEKLTGRKVWHVGPTSLMVQKTLLPISNHPHQEEEHECLTWLNTKEVASVVYVCFGSLCRLSDDQLYQIAIGLEASGHKFLWVIQRNSIDSKEEIDHQQDNNNINSENNKYKWWLRFEEEVRKENRGMIIKGWAPQHLILNHPATGGFLTHCGWNAIVEAISAGVPMITMPGFSDQYYNEKLITEVHGFGVEVGATEWSMSPYDAKTKVVSGERIEKAVKRLMDQGDQSMRVIRSKAKELKEKAWNAVQENGSSHNSLITLLDYINTLHLPKLANDKV